MTLRSFTLTLLLTATSLVGADLSAQELAGVALGPDGEPLAGVSVILHGVGGGAGAMVGTDTTDAAGGFRFDLPVADSAVYFAALRYEGSLYIGPAAQAGAEPVEGYILRVGPESEAGAVASALSGTSPAPPPARTAASTQRRAGGSSDTGALILVGLLALAAVGAFLVAAPRYRRRRTLDSVIALAEAENALEDAGTDEDRDRLTAQRDRLRKQLAPQG